MCGVAPGTVLPEAESDAGSLARAASAAALQRIGSPRDIAGAVRYLVEAEYVTGIQLVVDGGRLLSLGCSPRPTWPRRPGVE